MFTSQKNVFIVLIASYYSAPVNMPPWATAHVAQIDHCVDLDHLSNCSRQHWAGLVQLDLVGTFLKLHLHPIVIQTEALSLTEHTVNR